MRILIISNGGSPSDSSGEPPGLYSDGDEAWCLYCGAPFPVDLVICVDPCPECGYVPD